MTKEARTVEFPTIDFNLPLRDLEGDSIQQRDEEGNASDLLLGDACVRSLLVTLEHDKSDGVQKLKRFNLAQRIKGSMDEGYIATTLNSKQKKLILDQAEKAYTTLIYARIYEALEGSTREGDEG